MASPIAEQIAALLTPYLGAFNAKVAVKTFSTRTLKIAPESLAGSHLPALLDALRPTLYTLVGRASTDVLLDKIGREVK
jgi:hypothetical protein